MKKFVKGQIYDYSDIEPLSHSENEEEEADFQETELGKWICGERFLVLNHTQKDLTISFVLSGIRAGESVWECVYSDQK
jgi:hypothetical protein